MYVFNESCECVATTATTVLLCDLGERNEPVSIYLLTATSWDQLRLLRISRSRRDGFGLEIAVLAVFAGQGFDARSFDFVCLFGLLQYVHGFQPHHVQCRRSV